MAKASKSKGRVKFKNPPVNELVMAIYHLPIIELKAQHIGRYWETIRKQFPICDQAPPIISAQGTLPPDAPGEIFPLPRFWFHSGVGTPLIQLQRDAFIFNWRSGDKTVYPHYEAVQKQFAAALSGYRKFLAAVLGHKLDVVSRCELTYINMIVENSVWKNASSIGKVFPPLAGLESIHTDSRELVGTNSSFTYKFANNLIVDSVVRIGRKADTQELAAIFELKAQGTPEGLGVDAIHEWFNSAHDATHDMFLNFTSQTMQTEVWIPMIGVT